MDPTIEFVVIRDSFSSDRPTITPDKLPERYRSLPLILSRPLADNVVNLPPIYGGEEYLQLMQLKSQFDPAFRKLSGVSFEELRSLANPFENIGHSVFFTRAAVKLAAVDALYNLTLFNVGILSYTARSTLPFTFCDIAGGPGSFTQYLLYRLPRAVGYGITLKGRLDWNLSKLDSERFQPFCGSKNDGDLFHAYREYIQYVRSFAIEGVDLAVCDGGVEIDEYEKEEFTMSRLVLTQLYTGLCVLRKGGCMVCKMFDSVTEVTAQIIFIMSCCFESIQFLKPLSSRPANAERYIICLGRKGVHADPRSDSVIGAYTRLMEQALQMYDRDREADRTADRTGPGKMVTRLFSQALPEDYVDWLKRQNSLMTQRQMHYGGILLELLTKGKVDIPEYNLQAALTVWNLPDG